MKRFAFRFIAQLFERDIESKNFEYSIRYLLLRITNILKV